MADHNSLIDELLAYDGEALTAWEVEFVDSLDKQRRSAGDDWEPSSKQEAILRKIAEKI